MYWAITLGTLEVQVTIPEYEGLPLSSGSCFGPEGSEVPKHRVCRVSIRAMVKTPLRLYRGLLKGL